MRAVPNVAICGALILHATGESERAVRVLAAIHEHDVAPWRSLASLEIARIKIDQGDTREAGVWVSRVREEELLTLEHRGGLERVKRSIGRAARD